MRLSASLLSTDDQQRRPDAPVVQPTYSAGRSTELSSPALLASARPIRNDPTACDQTSGGTLSLAYEKRAVRPSRQRQPRIEKADRRASASGSNADGGAGAGGGGRFPSCAAAQVAGETAADPGERDGRSRRPPACLSAWSWPAALPGKEGRAGIVLSASTSSSSPPSKRVGRELASSPSVRPFRSASWSMQSWDPVCSDAC